MSAQNRYTLPRQVALSLEGMFVPLTVQVINRSTDFNYDLVIEERKRSIIIRWKKPKMSKIDKLDRKIANRLESEEWED